MLQVVQNLGTGTTEVLEVPDPTVRSRALLIATAASLISAGTERMLVEFGRSNLLEKARQQPEKVRLVLDRVRTDGLLTTIDAVRSKLDQPIAAGYCNVGRVIEVGRDVQGFAVGDLVVSNGPHAEIVRVPANLCALVPQGVDEQAASFTVAASIALQGIRLAAPTLGETFAVIGLGLLGQLAVQLLRANGCAVLGIDPDAERLRLAAGLGATVAGPDTDPVGFAMAATNGRGVDGVIIAAATSSNDPIRSAAAMSRKRGRLVLVGVTGLDLLRSDFYEKELSFQVSCSYGPGRYDPQYEEKGNDYPFGLVRWTAQRNFEACLDLLASDRLKVAPLITHRFGIEQAAQAYDLLLQDRSALGIVLQYANGNAAKCTARRPVRSVQMRKPGLVAATTANPVVAFIGAGNYASRILLPAFAEARVDLHTLVNTGSVLGPHSARKFGFRFASTDLDTVLAAPEVDAVVIATRHDSHGSLAARALRAGKDVFVEKPLALTAEDLQQIEALLQREVGTSPRLMVGFNRRFAPTVARLKSELQARGTAAFIYTVNAGAVPRDHWTLDSESGGGRLVGEACHFVDLLRYLAAAPIEECCVYALDRDDLQGTFSIGLRFTNGAMGTVHYLANGHPAFPKERLEVFCGGSVLQLDNFRGLRGYGIGAGPSWGIRRQDKGHRQCIRAFVDAIRHGAPTPIPAEEILEVSSVVVKLGNLWRARDPKWLRVR